MDLSANQAMNEPINQVARKHEETVQDWDYAEIGRTLYRWNDLFNIRFFNSELPTPLLSFRRVGTKVYGHYVPGRNEIGAKQNVNINPVHLVNPLADVLETLAHEQVHIWQANYGKPGRRNYHNRQCRRKMAEIGIPCDKWGRSLGMIDPFVSFLREHGVDANTRLEVPREETAQPSGGHLTKWHCCCTNIWAAVEVLARCERCHREFEKIAFKRKTNLASRNGNKQDI